MKRLNKENLIDAIKINKLLEKCDKRTAIYVNLEEIGHHFKCNEIFIKYWTGNKNIISHLYVDNVNKRMFQDKYYYIDDYNIPYYITFIDNDFGTPEIKLNQIAKVDCKIWNQLQEERYNEYVII